jgi:hypothetical protein
MASTSIVGGGTTIQSLGSFPVTDHGILGGGPIGGGGIIIIATIGSTGIMTGTITTSGTTRSNLSKGNRLWT